MKYNAQAKQLLTILNNRTSGGFEYESQNRGTRLRLVQNGGSKNVSNLLTAKEMVVWMNAFLDGINYMEEITQKMFKEI